MMIDDSNSHNDYKDGDNNNDVDGEDDGAIAQRYVLLFTALVLAGVGKAVAAALAVTAAVSSAPDEAAAIGPIKMLLTDPEYHSVACPPKTQVELFVCIYIYVCCV